MLLVWAFSCVSMFCICMFKPSWKYFCSP